MSPVRSMVKVIGRSLDPGDYRLRDFSRGPHSRTPPTGSGHLRPTS
jgi:hypothetical protein